MSVRRLAPKELQPASFAFREGTLDWAKQQIAKYPEGRQASACIAILWRVGSWYAEHRRANAGNPVPTALRFDRRTIAVALIVLTILTFTKNIYMSAILGSLDIVFGEVDR